MESKTKSKSAIDFEPVRELLLIQLPTFTGKTESGVLMPEVIKDRSYPMFGLVIGRGPNASEISLGDVIYAPLKNEKGINLYMPIEIDGEEYGLVSKINIYGVITGKEKQKIKKEFFPISK